MVHSPCEFLSPIAAISAWLGGFCCCYFGFACTLSCLTRGIGSTGFQLVCSSFINVISTSSHKIPFQYFYKTCQAAEGFIAIKVFSVLQPTYNTYLGIVSTRQSKSNVFFWEIEYELTFPIYNVQLWGGALLKSYGLEARSTKINVGRMQTLHS